MLSMLISVPVSIPLGAVSLAGVSVSAMDMVLTKKYQKKLVKVMKLVDIITSTLAVFETSVSKTLNNCKNDGWEFAMFQTLHLEVLNDICSTLVVRWQLKLDLSSKKVHWKESST